jgi:DNA-directed RNA polymerase subunit alpha
METNSIIDHSWSGVHLPEDVKVIKDDGKRGIFVVEPLEPGYGTFVGNALRRVLISSLHGAAIFLIRIPGVEHEFSTVPDVAEDVTNIILNLKKVRFRYHHDEPIKLKIDVHSPRGEGSYHVCASDIDTSNALNAEGEPLIEVLNPEHHIATLNAGASFTMELWIDSSYGYADYEELSSRYAQDPQRPPRNALDGTVSGEMNQVALPALTSLECVAIDAIYRPIERVNFRVMPARLGESTRHDRLELEIDGDGSVTPREALAFAAKILKEQMKVFATFREESDERSQEVVAEVEQQFNPSLYKPVEELELSVRSSNCLKSAHITYIGELVQKTPQEMLKTKNFGRKSLRELEDVLKTHNLQLAMKIEGWSPDNAPKS